jgi:hypothetical protein
MVLVLVVVVVLLVVVLVAVKEVVRVGSGWSGHDTKPM